VIDESQINKQKKIIDDLNEQVSQLKDSNSKLELELENADCVQSAPPQQIVKEVVVEKPVIKEVINFFNKIKSFRLS
jgi:regulator of replication initiation timing